VSRMSSQAIPGRHPGCWYIERSPNPIWDDRSHRTRCTRAQRGRDRSDCTEDCFYRVGLLHLTFVVLDKDIVRKFFRPDKLGKRSSETGPPHISVPFQRRSNTNTRRSCCPPNLYLTGTPPQPKQAMHERNAAKCRLCERVPDPYGQVISRSGNTRAGVAAAPLRAFVPEP